MRRSSAFGVRRGAPGMNQCGGARFVDFSGNLGFGSGGWPTAVSRAAKASVLESLRTY